MHKNIDMTSFGEDTPKKKKSYFKGMFRTFQTIFIIFHTYLHIFEEHFYTFCKHVEDNKFSSGVIILHNIQHM